MVGNPAGEDRAANPGLPVAAFEGIFDRHYLEIRAYLARRVGPSLAEDLASQVFEEALINRDKYDEARGTTRAWLFGISANRLRRHRRTEVRQLRAFARSGVDPYAPVDIDEADDRLDASRQGPTVAGALANLSSAQREVLLLHAWGDLSDGEIAMALGCPLGTVRSRLSRARRAMREQISASGQVLHDSRVGPEET